MDRLLVDADPARLGEVTAFAAGDLPPGYQGDALRVALAVEELFVNVCAHAYGGRGGTVEIARGTVPDGEGGEWLVITVADRGTPFNPFEEAPAPDLEGPLETRRVGGLGVHLVRCVAGGCFWRWTGEGNESEIRFRRKP